jgi:hypothetical protein
MEITKSDLKQKQSIIRHRQNIFQKYCNQVKVLFFPCKALRAESVRLTLSPPAVKTQCLSQCQAFQCHVRSSHTLDNWILNNFLSTKSIFKQFSVCFSTHSMLFASVCNINTPGQQVRQANHFSFPCQVEFRCRLFATSAEKGLTL